MEKTTNFLNKYGMIILMFFVLIIFFKTCGINSNIEKVGRRIDGVEKIISKLDSTVNTKISNEKIDLLLKINALEISREILYSENAVVRTKERPDDIINSYNKQIKELQEKLKNVK